jgi:hypothetical protein
MDVKETNPYLRSLAHFPPQAAFRYHQQANEAPTLALAWVRFPDSSVLAAVAETAEITTMVTNEGRSLTEVKLTVKNQAQPFLKVALPAGATILTAEVAGEKVKPVQGPDGNRVPLLRPGFRPTGPYSVSFVFLHSGAPFARKGNSELSLPSMDLPIDVMHWEVFLPEQYKVKDFAGDVIAEEKVPLSEISVVNGTLRGSAFAGGIGSGGGIGAGFFRHKKVAPPGMPGQMAGTVMDPSGAAVSGATVNINSPGFDTTTTTDGNGEWVIANAPSGRYRITVTASGFSVMTSNVNFDSTQPFNLDTNLNVGTVNEAVTVEAQSVQQLATNGRNFAALGALAPGVAQPNSISANLVNLQRRVAGVLPVAIEVPRSGTSFRFVRPLVLNEETRVTFNYKNR